MPVHRLNDVARLDAGVGRTALRIDVLHDETGRVLRCAQARRELRGQRRNRHAQRRPVVVAVRPAAVAARRLAGVQFVQLHADVFLRTVANDDEIRRAARPGLRHPITQRVEIVHLHAIERLNHVALFQPRPIGCAVRRHRAYDGAAGALQSKTLRHLRRHLLHGHAQLRARDLALRPQLLHHALRHVHRNSEADTDVAAGLRQDLRVDANELAPGVDERAAGIPVVDGRVGLEEILIAAVANRRGSSFAADDAHRNRLPDAKWIAHGEHDVADFHRVGIAERDRLEAGAANLE